MYERGGGYHLAGRALGEVVHDGRQARSTRAAGGSCLERSWTGTPWAAISAAIEHVGVEDAPVYGFACFDLAAQIGTGTSPVDQDATFAHMIVPGLEVEISAGRGWCVRWSPRSSTRWPARRTGCGAPTPPGGAVRPSTCAPLGAARRVRARHDAHRHTESRWTAAHLDVASAADVAAAYTLTTGG
ncbi:MAG: Salicylate synthase [Pseudonocardia sp.]|nr:Salicylate synthase [Pseudonocardia sp.]